MQEGYFISLKTITYTYLLTIKYIPDYILGYYIYTLTYITYTSVTLLLT